MLSPRFGNAVNAIETAGFPVAERVECLLDSDTSVAVAKAIGLATMDFATVFARTRPDAILVMADRSEMLAPANAALATRIPIIHVEGGEASEGVIDHAVRNALTMMSHVHLVTTELAAGRLQRMGESPDRIHRTGAGSLDHLVKSDLPSPGVVLADFDITLPDDVPYALIAHHPLTLDATPAAEIDGVLAALEPVDRPLIFCHPNADEGSRAMIDRVRAFCSRGADRHLLVNLPPRSYWGLLRGAAWMAGNSSSGVMESTSAGIPAIDIGDRQRGREAGPNVMRVPGDVASIAQAIGVAETPACQRAAREAAAGGLSPYGDGRAAERIVEAIRSTDFGPAILRKMAIEVPEVDRTDAAPHPSF